MEEEKIFAEYYNILHGNEGKEIELQKVRDKKYKEAEKNIIDHSKYEYNFLLKEFSQFIKNISKDYSNAKTRLVARCINEKEIVYNDYYTKDAIIFLKEFLEKNKLGTVEYNKVIIWNDGITLENLIKSYFDTLNSLKHKMVSTKELKEEYLKMLDDDNKEFAPLITDKFRTIINCKENIPYRFYYDLQLELETYGYNELLIKEINEEKIYEFFNINDMDKNKLLYLLNILRQIKSCLTDYLEMKKDESINRKRG